MACRGSGVRVPSAPLCGVFGFWRGAGLIGGLRILAGSEGHWTTIDPTGGPTSERSTTSQSDVSAVGAAPVWAGSQDRKCHDGYAAPRPGLGRLSSASSWLGYRGESPPRLVRPAPVSQLLRQLLLRIMGSRHVVGRFATSVPFCQAQLAGRTNCADFRAEPQDFRPRCQSRCGPSD